jgi:hypothetical protein
VFDPRLLTKNISDKLFPGGQLSSISLTFADHSVSKPTDVLPIPPIQSGDSMDIHLPLFLAASPGQAWLETVIKANDGEGIECFQQEDGPFTLGRWSHSVYVVDRELYRMIKLLEHFTAKEID